MCKFGCNGLGFSRYPRGRQTYLYTTCWLKNGINEGARHLFWPLRPSSQQVVHHFQGIIFWMLLLVLNLSFYDPFGSLPTCSNLPSQKELYLYFIIVGVLVSRGINFCVLVVVVYCRACLIGVSFNLFYEGSKLLLDAAKLQSTNRCDLSNDNIIKGTKAISI